MDINQLAQMIEWLDEERRRDKATIATLEERLAHQMEIVSSLQRRITEVESSQGVLQESTFGAGNEVQLLDAVRKEMGQLVEKSESRRLNAEREAERRNELVREGQQRAIRDINDRIDKMNRSVASLNDMRGDANRTQDAVLMLQQQIDDLGKKLEEPDRRLAFLEEQRRQDARRISENETEIPELKKQLESIRPKMTLIEDLAIRNERRVQELTDTERERREQLQQFIDSQSLMNQQRDQQVTEIGRRFDEQTVELQQYIERFETWSQAYREMKRIIDDFERIGDRLERRINEVAEMQRLSEERFRTEWNDWREDHQRRWKQLTLSNDEVWRNHDKEFENYIKRLESMEKEIPAMLDNVQRLWKLERERAQLYRERYQAMLLAYDTAGAIYETAPDSPTNGKPNGNGGNGGNGTNGYNNGNY